MFAVNIRKISFDSTIAIEDQFNSDRLVEAIEFYDTSTLDLTTVEDYVLTGTDSNETLFGVYDGADTLKGGAGNDVYYASATNL